MRSNHVPNRVVNADHGIVLVLRAGDHRCQLVHENGAIVIATPRRTRRRRSIKTLQSPAGQLYSAALNH